MFLRPGAQVTRASGGVPLQCRHAENPLQGHSEKTTFESLLAVKKHNL
jgi:hypothetical protein